MTVAIALFTQDLRLHDNPVLRAALGSADEVVPLFVLDDRVRAAGFAVPNRAAFLADCLRDLDAGLRERGGRLVLRTGEAVAQTVRLAELTGAVSVHLAAGVSGFAQRREERLRAALGERLVVHEAVLTAVAPGAVTPAGKDHYAVFTPYFRAWQQAGLRRPLGAPRTVRVPADVEGDPVPEVRPDSPGLPAGGESAGRARWNAWQGDGYEELHDDLAGDGTSRLSPYLHFGCLSANELIQRGGPGEDAFVRQLAWRDFHHQVLAARPASAHADYRDRGDAWRKDPAEVEAWRTGRTGYPIVDAGMRQLAHEGWMHNRARLLTASFLAKTLYQDWRVGAAHFLSLLVDGDVANNQLNWQWVAGTGTDTRPNRVLNPLAQARRFDPRGDYVRRWVPELAGIPDRAVHQPWLLREKPDYPAPIVDLATAGQRFRTARGLD
ncbi:cryptochrome/photolyase family protein [Kitasatospora mediocidica]|uniref:cryptochrome/photolyase family protein n=1 Tax=Kitasatospora mediocidica TaxID=58352 RepID=UPI000566FD7C|nr:deoxyribodipyrimidine photo-lyase [Kitasatospora mediocidica]